MRQRATAKRFWERKMKKTRRGGGRGGKKIKNRQKRKRIKPDWECLPRVVLVTLNYKWSLTFQAKAHSHNKIPMMHFHWQTTPLSLGLNFTTNLCPLLFFSSITFSVFSVPRVKDFTNFALLCSSYLQHWSLCSCIALTNKLSWPDSSSAIIAVWLQKMIKLTCWTENHNRG